jgi:hypothetical protein
MNRITSWVLFVLAAAALVFGQGLLRAGERGNRPELEIRQEGHDFPLNEPGQLRGERGGFRALALFQVCLYDLKEGFLSSYRRRFPICMERL